MTKEQNLFEEKINWHDIYQQNFRFLKNRDKLLILEAPYNISFPIKYNKERDYGGVVFLEKQGFNINYQQNPGENITIKSFYNLIQEKAGKFNVIQEDKPQSNLETFLTSRIQSHHYKLLTDFINQFFHFSAPFIEINSEWNLHSDLFDMEGYFEIEGNSLDLALFISLILGKFLDIKKRNLRLSFTGILDKDGNIRRVKSLKEKIIAVFSCKIEYLFIPFENKDDLPEFVTKENDIYFVDRKEKYSPLKLIPVRDLNNIFVKLAEHENLFDVDRPQEWYKDPALRQLFDLKYQYQQRILNSRLVKIENIFWEGNDEIDLSQYVELQLIEKEDIKKRLEKEKEGKSLDEILKETEEKAKAILPLEVLKKIKNGNHFITIFGAAGAGKTTLLKKFLEQLCKERVEELADYIPLFLEVKTLEKNKNAIVKCIENIGLEKTFQNYLLNYDKEGKTIYLLDAFDEAVKKNEVIDTLKEYVTNKKVVLTSRYDPTLPQFIEGESYEILPLSKEAAEKFIKNYVQDPNQQNELFSLIDTDGKFSGFTSNPLMLSLITYLVSKDLVSKELLSNKIYIIREAIKKLIWSLERKLNKTRLQGLSILFNFSSIEDFLISILSFHEFVAYNSFEDADINKSIHEGLKKYFSKPKKESLLSTSEKIGELLEIVTNRIGIIKNVSANSNSEYRFFHRVFCEFLMASFVAKHLPEEKFIKWINEHKFDIRYEPIFEFLAGILDLMAYEEENPNISF